MTISKNFRKLFSPLVCLILSSCSTSSVPMKPVDKVSFFHGYSIHKNQLADLEMPYNIYQVVAGMVAAEKGDSLPFDQEELETLISAFKEEMQANQIKNNLIEAENYLLSVASDPKIIELVPQKLYSLILKQGDGKEILEDDIVLSKYTTYILKNGKEKTDFINESHPVPISYADTIPGFAEGTKGMQVGERRKLFIHPDLAFGTHGGKLKPNQLFIIEIEAVDLQN